MDIQNELQKFHQIVQGFDSNITDYQLLRQLFKSPGFKLFSQKTSQAVIVFNFLENRYEYVSDSIETISGLSAETIMGQQGVFRVAESMSPASAQMMIQVLTPLMFEYCTKFPADVPNMRFTACIQYNPPGQKSKWLLCHDNILCVTPQNHPLLSCTILTDITEIKKDTSLYYSIHNRDKLLLQKSLGQDTLDFTLTDRELEIVELLSKGKTTKEIAEDLFISFETVKKHRSNILSKTKCNNTAELINALSFMGFV